MASDLPVFGYWNIRGLGQPIRLLLAYTETEYTDKRYNYGPPHEDQVEWYESKKSFGLDFPNLPYYIDGDVKITQSLTIMRYLSKKHRLAGHNEREKIRIDVLEGQLKDYRAGFLEATFDPHFETARVEYLKTVPSVLKSLSDFLGDHPYFAGKSISYVDFIAYEFIDLHYYLEPELFAHHPNLKEFLGRIEELPTVHKYQYSDNYIRWPSGLVVRWYKNVRACGVRVGCNSLWIGWQCCECCGIGVKHRSLALALTRSVWKGEGIEQKADQTHKKAFNLFAIFEHILHSLNAYVLIDFSGLTSKGENKSKQKYQSLNINNLYKGKSLETTKTSVAPKHGLQTLGKVGAGRRMPPPANLPSLKSQTTTNQNITLVPTGGQGWGSGKDEDSGATPPLQTSSTGVDAQPLSAQKPSAGPLNPLMTSSTATTDTNVGAIALGLTSAALTAQSKTWSTITATAEHPESGPEKSFSVQQLPFFPQEFPKLDGGNAPQDATTKPSAEISYGPGPSLRPQTEGSWGRGTLQAPQPGINPNANQSPNAGSAASGQPPSHPNDQNIPQMARGLYPQSGGPPTQRGPMPGAVPIMPAANQTGGPLMPGQQPMNFNQYRMITPYPPHMSYPGQRGAYPTGPFPPQGFTPHGPINTRQPYFPDRAGQRPGEESGGPPGRPAPPIITDKDLKGFDDMLDSGVQKGWAAQNTEVDYNAKIMFSDDENDDSHPNKEPNYDPREVRHSGDGRQKDRERRERDSDRGEERPKSYRSPQQQQWQNQSQNMAPNPRNSNYDNQPQQQHPHHDSQQPYPRSQDRHSQNYPHSRHNRSDHPMADDDE
ncbi:unnamed protein product, partial [Medioppia subpectinata]